MGAPVSWIFNHADWDHCVSFCAYHLGETTMRTRFVWASLLLLALATTTTASAADHRDGPSTIADPSADINDVYTFVDGGRLVLAMTVLPLAESTSKFSDAIQYVFHVQSGPAFGNTPNTLDIICTFDADQTASCWAGDQDYVTGDASAEAGISSKSGDLKVFAGSRRDPFFFNLEGFNDTVATVKGAAATLTFDAAGCPALDAATSTALIGQLQGTAAGTAPAEDFFATLNTLAIVVSIDPSLLPDGHVIASVWASTHQAQ